MKQLVIIITALFCFSGALLAQDSYFGDFKSDTDMEVKTPGQNLFNKGVQYGGWLTPVMYYSKDNTAELSQSINTLRLWFRTFLWNDASLYIRGKYTFTGTMYEKDSGASDTGHVVDLDIASLNMSFFNKQLTVQAGRKYFLVGSGLVLNNRADGMEVNYFNKYVNVQAMASYTGLLLKDSNPYFIKTADLSGSEDYFFAGGTLSGSYFNQTLYFIALAQKQFEDGPGGKLENQFYGGGLKGAIIDGLTYYVEFVYQLQSNSGEDFTEMGTALEVKYSLDTVTKPVFMFQYAYGSGSDTTKFINYGTYNAGLGWNPELKNLHVLRFGTSVSPTDMVSINWLKRMSFIFKYSLYLVDDDSAVVGTAGETTTTPAPGEKIAGHGLDFALRWRIFSDLSFFANYGVYVPGPAFGSSDPNRHFAMGGLNISF